MHDTDIHNAELSQAAVDTQHVLNTGLSTQLDLVGIGYRIQQKTILQNVNLSLPSQGITTVLGFNGAGKSVLLKIMHGIVSPTNGDILWNSQAASFTHRKTQAMVFQKPVLLRRSVKANMDFVLKPRNKDYHTRREELLELVGLQGQSSQAARLLSGGEQQRLALARALACEPAILFLDEATASLDSASTAIIERIVQTEASAGTKIIMVTHDAAQASRLADDVVFMHEGTVTEHTQSQDFFNKPSSEPAKAYLQGRLYGTET